jgi:hypothetical protein
MTLAPDSKLRMMRQTEGRDMAQSKPKGTLLRPVHLLLLLPFIAMLWVALYNRAEPSIAGIPFFYWFQLLWIPLGALLLWPVYRAEDRDNDRRRQ